MSNWTKGLRVHELTGLFCVARGWPAGGVISDVDADGGQLSKKIVQKGINYSA